MLQNQIAVSPTSFLTFVEQKNVHMTISMQNLAFINMDIT